jgi:hypothetical protein
MTKITNGTILLVQTNWKYFVLQILQWPKIHMQPALARYNAIAKDEIGFNIV